jgi:hypothetical protein
MNIGMRLAIIVLLSIISQHHAAAAMSVCREGNAAIAIAELSQQGFQR